MTRVSENSSHGAVKYSLNRNKHKLENLQLKGSTLKRITRPSDDPISNVETLSLKSRINDNKQYIKNANYAVLNLNATEKSIEQLTEIMGKAKEIAIAQSSDFYDSNIRKNIANEVSQLRNQALAIANKRIGNKFLFGGYKSLQKPFEDSGEYKGDKGSVSLEISKDFFVPINLNGHEVFYSTGDSSAPDPLDGLIDFKKDKNNNIEIDNKSIKDVEVDPNQPLLKNNGSRDLASSDTTNSDGYQKVDNIFTQLDGLVSALENNDPVLIRSLLEKIDSTSSRLITLRTKIGSVSNSIESSKLALESDNVDASDRKSKLEDADVAELFSDITRQQNVLKTSYQASQGLINQTLLDFIR